jgi:hypothetical protein
MSGKAAICPLEGGEAMATAHEQDAPETEVLELVQKLEESVMEAGRTWAIAVGKAMPVDLPVVRQLVKGSFDFGEKVLKAQRELVQGVLQVARQSARPVPRGKRTAPGRRATPRTKPTTKAA